MTNKYVLQKLIDWLNSLGDSELEQLSVLFSDSEVRESLLVLISRVIALRTFEKGRKPQVYSGAKALAIGKTKVDIRRAETVGRQPEVKDAIDLKKVFFEMFENDTVFPSRRDMLEEMNRVFNCGIEYNKNEKKGRRDLITKCWSRVKKVPGDELRKKLGNLVGRFENRPDKDEYKELFRILANHE